MYYFFYICRWIILLGKHMNLRFAAASALLSLLLSLLGTGEAAAQRTSDGSVFIGASQIVSGYAVPSGGLDIGAGGYLSSSFWKAGARAVDWNHRIGSDTEGGNEDALFDHIAWQFYGGWRYRVVGTYNRAISLYAGADAFLGFNQHEVFRNLPWEIQTGLPSVEFAYGAVPEIELEWFVSPQVALTLGVQCPVTLGTSLTTDDWNLTGSLGVRINLIRR